MQYLEKAESLTRWSVYALFALTPLFFIPVSWVSIPQSKTFLATVAVTVAFLAWVARSLNTGSFRFPKSSLLIAAALIPVVYLISAIATGFSLEAFAGDGRGQDTVIRFLLLYLAFFISAEVLGRVGVVPALRALLVGSVAVLAIQSIHLIAPSFTFGGALPVPAASIAGSWHDLGILLALAVFISLSLGRTAVFEGYWKLLGFVATFLGLFFLVVINLSDVWLGILGLSVFAAFWKYKTTPAGISFNIRSCAAWIFLGLLSIGMYFGGDTLKGALPESLQVAQIEVRPSWQGTFAVGVEVFAEPAQIFFGSGPNTFSREWGVHKPLSVNETQFWNTDFYYGVGFIPTSLVSTGIMGLIAWGAVCFALLWGLYQLFRQSSRATLLNTALMGSAIFLTMFHVLYVPGPGLSLITFLVFGVLVAERIFAGEGQEWSLSLDWQTWKGRVLSGVLVILALIVLFGSVQSLRATLSDVFVNRAVAQYNMTGDSVKASQSLARALRILSKNDTAHRAGVELGLLRLSQLAAEGSVSESARAELQATLAATIQHGLAAVSIENTDYQNWLTLARLYGELAGVGVEGAEKNARDAYNEAKTRGPSNPLPYLGEAQLELVRGDDAAARASLEAALERKPNLAAAHFLLSQIHARAGDLPKAREHAGATVQSAPNDPLGWYNLGTILYAEDSYAEAALAFEQAVRLQNNYANALFLLGISYQRLERYDEALQTLKAVSALNQDNTEVKQLIVDVERQINTAGASAQ